MVTSLMTVAFLSASIMPGGSSRTQGMRRQPSQENARAAKRAFLTLAKRHHPDQGGTHDEFLRLKDAYDRALAAWRRVAA
jgi:hypothetical protein